MKTVNAYLDEQWNQPGLTEFYLMQICQKICQILSQKPERIHIEDFKLGFDTSKKSKVQETLFDKREKAHQRFLDRKAALSKVM